MSVSIPSEPHGAATRASLTRAVRVNRECTPRAARTADLPVGVVQGVSPRRLENRRYDVEPGATPPSARETPPRGSDCGAGRTRFSGSDSLGFQGFHFLANQLRDAVFGDIDVADVTPRVFATSRAGHP